MLVCCFVGCLWWGRWAGGFGQSICLTFFSFIPQFPARGRIRDKECGGGYRMWGPVFSGELRGVVWAFVSVTVLMYPVLGLVSYLMSSPPSRPVRECGGSRCSGPFIGLPGFVCWSCMARYPYLLVVVLPPLLCSCIPQCPCGVTSDLVTASLFRAASGSGP